MGGKLVGAATHFWKIYFLAVIFFILKRTYLAEGKAGVRRMKDEGKSLFRR